MSIRATFNDSIAAVRTIFDLEDEVALAADSLRTTLLAGHKTLVCGNGGSASDSAHLAAELACRFVSDRRPYPAISLTGDSALITARIQEAHKVIIHLLCELVEPDLAKE